MTPEKCKINNFLCKSRDKKGEPRKSIRMYGKGHRNEKKSKNQMRNYNEPKKIRGKKKRKGKITWN